MSLIRIDSTYISYKIDKKLAGAKTKLSFEIMNWSFKWILRSYMT